MLCINDKLFVNPKFIKTVYVKDNIGYKKETDPAIFTIVITLSTIKEKDSNGNVEYESVCANFSSREELVKVINRMMIP